MKKFSLLFLLALATSLALFASCSQDVADFADEMEEEEIELAEADEDDEDDDEEEGVEEVVEVADSSDTSSQTEVPKATSLGGAVKGLASAVFAPVTSILSGLSGFFSSSDNSSKK
ncbi:hypothetical protein DB313_05405 (plasmid) [Borrelia turcica IST7]|uniref:Variable large protein n=1 Tax=Borrelia turcica IST7 TaxID=1104446 RepID=A0A386PQD1_9SPIR|nr:hypothetical protein [Borrelia turcica]AYE36937.1 hypothetical protein DB313_05405 [Borrelia turcica IST7]